ncbi:MAG: hypothetical protein JRI96_16460, partial [Deltaproteobacteria bacterium]|nr:hypothetical protein [Deltaproteobacteria bacterium]
LLEDKELRKHLTEEDIDGVFSLDYHLKHVDEIFDRVFTLWECPVREHGDGK